MLLFRSIIPDGKMKSDRHTSRLLTRRRLRTLRRGSLFLLFLAAGASVLAVVSLRPDGVLGPEQGSQPDLVLVLVAGLRADIPGQPAAEARFLQPVDDALSTLGLKTHRRFTAAYAQSSHGFMSLGSILAGRYPSNIPLCSTAGVPAGQLKSREWCLRFPAARPTLPRVLAAYGYNTALLSAGIEGANYLAGEFAQVWHFQPTILAAPAQEGVAWGKLRKQARTWWTQQSSGPRLLVVASADLDLRILVNRSPDRLKFGGGGAGDLPASDAGSPTAASRELYGRMARTAGSRVARLLLDLPDGGGARPRWIVVAGLHGMNLIEPKGFPSESPNEAGRDFHSHFLLDRTLRVPLLVAGPGLGAGTYDRPVELIDILPTLAKVARARLPAGIHGRNLLAREPDPDPVAYAQFGDMRCLRSGPLMLTFRGFLHSASSLDPDIPGTLRTSIEESRNMLTLNNVIKDPWQEHDLSGSSPVQLRQLHAELVSREEKLARVPREAGSQAELRQLLRNSPSVGYW